MNPTGTLLTYYQKAYIISPTRRYKSGKQQVLWMDLVHRWEKSLS